MGGSSLQPRLHDGAAMHVRHTEQLARDRMRLSRVRVEAHSEESQSVRAEEMVGGKGMRNRERNLTQRKKDRKRAGKRDF